MLKDIVSKIDEGRTPPGMELQKNQIQFRSDTMSTVQGVLSACKELEKIAKKAKKNDHGYPEDDFEMGHWLTIIAKSANTANSQIQMVSTVPGSR